MSAINHRIALSLSVSAPMSSATYRMGAASVSICRLLAATVARSACRAEQHLVCITMMHKRRASVQLPHFETSERESITALSGNDAT
jgi:hypothetical protein